MIKLTYLTRDLICKKSRGVLKPGQCCLHGRHVESRGLSRYVTVSCLAE